MTTVLPADAPALADDQPEGITNPTVAPTPAPPPDPQPPKEEPNPYDDYFNQQVGARKALLASSINAAVEAPADQHAKTVALADKLGISADVVRANYDYLSKAVQLRDVDYSKLLANHPELSSWLAKPENAAVAHDDLPVLRTMDRAFKTLAGYKSDATGILPDGFMFKADGTIRGPLHEDGTPPVIYKNLDAVRAKFEREAGQALTDQYVNQAAADQLRQNRLFPDLSAGVESSIATTLAAVARATGNRMTVAGFAGDELAQGAGRLQAGSEVNDPSALGSVARTAGSLLGDAPLYLLGGEVAAPIEAVAGTLRAVSAGAKALPLAPRSEYLLDAFKTAAAYSPVAARSGVNTGAENGTAYGIQDFLINSLGPAAFGSRFGLAAAIVPGRETAAAANGWLGVAGRVLTHAGSQGGIMAATELANALHEKASGVNPDVLDRDQLLPRLGQAGAMGAVLSGAFHLPGQIGEQVHRQQIAAHAAMDRADQLGAITELYQASKTAGRSPDRLQELLKGIPEEARTTHYQPEDFDGVAKDAEMTPEDLAAAMHVEEAYRIAKVTGQSIPVPTADMIRAIAGLEKPEGITSALLHSRQVPEGVSAQDALNFYKEKPVEIDAQIAAMKQDLGQAAKSMSEADPIYQDFLGKAIDAGRPPDEAKQDARLMAAFFNTKAERWNQGAAERGAKAIDPLEEYQAYQLRVEHDGAGKTGMEPLDAMLDRLRKGDIPSEEAASNSPLGDFLRKEDLLDEDGEPKESAAEAAHAEGLITDAKPETLTDALAAERELPPTDLGRIRAGHLALGEHLKSKGIDLARTNAEIKALLSGEDLPAVARYEQRLEVPSNHLRHQYLLEQWKKAHGDRTPTPTDKDWQRLVHQADMVDEAQGRKFFQGDDSKGHRGSLSYNAERHFLITLTGKANLSTVLHESGHFFLEAMGDYAEREGAPEQFKSDYADILKFLGVEKRGDIGIEHHEKWARATEQYLMEGHAPSPELRPVFQRFALWLSHLYSKIKSLVTLTPDVKRVFDRMLATDEAIQRAREETGSSSLFPSREASGMSEREWAAYLKENERERGAVNSRVFNQAMATLRRENTKVYRREKAQAMQDAADIVNARPISIAEDYLVHGRGPDGKDLAEKPKLDRAEIEREYGKGTLHKLPRGISEEGGMSLQMAADLFGFKTGDELWTALANLPDRKAEIRTMADGILKARNPDLSPEVMLGKAMEAVNGNAARADVLSRESAALAIKAGRRAIPREQIKQVAEGMIAETNHRDVSPNLYLRAIRTAAKDAADAFTANPPDYTAALLAKQREELAHALYSGSLEAKRVIDKTDEMMRAAKRTKTREMLGKAGGQSWIVTDPNGLVTPFLDQTAAADYAKSMGGTASMGPGFLAAMDQMRAVWNDRSIRTEMNYGAVSDFHDAAVSIMSQAREAHTILVDGEKQSLNEAVMRAIATENAVRPTALKEQRSLSGWDKFGRWLSMLDASQRKLSFVARQMDGEKDGGWHWENLVRPLNKASDRQQILRRENAEKLNQLMKEHGKQGEWSRKILIPAISDRLTLEGRVMVALNTGSTKNLRRLMEGEGWTREQVKAVTDTLDQKDWAFVRGVWDHINSYWPEINSLKSRLDGIPPEKRDSIPVETPFGTIDGKYFPIVYDPHRSSRGVDLSMEKKREPIFANPAHGFTEAAAEHVTNLHVLLDMRAITGHLEHVAHYISHGEAIRSLNKLLNNTPLAQNMIDRFGMETFRVVRDTVQDVAKGSNGPLTPVEQALRIMRQRSGMAVMGFNVMSGATQVFGMTQSMERVGAGAYLRAQQRVLQSAVAGEEISKMVMSKSAMMADRGNNQILEMVESRDVGAADSVPNWLRQHAYDLMHRAQWLVDLPTWLAGYENAMRDFPGDEMKARSLADQAVIDTQGTGLLKDQSKVQRANELTKTLLQFGSFFQSTYNLGRNRIASLDPKDPASYAKAAQSFLLLVSLPAVGMAAFKEAVRPSKDDDGSAEYWAKRLAKDHLGYLLSTVILGRELSGALDGFDYSGPSGMRSFGVISAFIKATGEAIHSEKVGHGFEKAAVMATGLWGLPAVQAQRIIDGILYDHEHGTADPRPLLFGKPGR